MEEVKNEKTKFIIDGRIPAIYYRNMPYNHMAIYEDTDGNAIVYFDDNIEIAKEYNNLGDDGYTVYDLDLDNPNDVIASFEFARVENVDDEDIVFDDVTREFMTFSKLQELYPIED